MSVSPRLRVPAQQSPAVSADAASPRRSRPSGGSDRARSLGHLSGLDGLRAIAVLAVLAYHDDLLQGGFLGVDVFFVISGFLITALLLAEHREEGRIDVKRFWFRRARRLLPALFLLLSAVLVFSVLVVPGELARLRGDSAAAFAYVTNWFLILGHQSYFDAVGRPSPLRHLWSLAVEEQFYVFWPLILSGALLLLRRWTPVVVAIAAGLSAIWMAVLFVPDADPSRVYYGTDTRVFALLIGAVLAFLWAPQKPRVEAAGWEKFNRVRADGWRRAIGWDVLAIGSLVAVFAFFAFADEYSPFLYLGGFALLAVFTALLIAAVIHPGGHLGPKLLDRQPLRWIGERSYSIYLWHWPVYMFTRPQLDVPLQGWANTVLRVALTLVLAECSYRFVETPIRQGAIGRAWTAWRAKPRQAKQMTYRWLAPVAAVLVVASLAVGASVVSAAPAPIPSYLAISSIDTVVSPATPSPSGRTASASGPQGRPAGSGTLTGSKPTGSQMPPSILPPHSRVFAIGDSVLLGASHELGTRIPGLEVNAAISRQWHDGIVVLQQRAAAGTLPDIVVIALGNNGVIFDRDFDAMMRALSGVQHVVVVNLHVPREWESRDNATLASGAQRWHATLVDWHDAGAAHPDVFYDDGMHLRGPGARLFATLVANGIAESLTGH